MKSKTSLAVVPAASSLSSLPATQPPPRKADIICALVERARVKHQEEVNAYKAQRENAEKAAADAIVQELKNNPGNFEIRVTCITSAYSKPEVEYTMKSVPLHIKKLRDDACKVPSMRPFDSAQVKRDITAKMSGGIAGDRVKALLSNPDTVKKLDETLEAML